MAEKVDATRRGVPHSVWVNVAERATILLRSVPSRNIRGDVIRNYIAVSKSSSIVHQYLQRGGSSPITMELASSLKILSAR